MYNECKRHSEKVAEMKKIFIFPELDENQVKILHEQLL